MVSFSNYLEDLGHLIRNSLSEIHVGRILVRENDPIRIYIYFWRFIFVLMSLLLASSLQLSFLSFLKAWRTIRVDGHS